MKETVLIVVTGKVQGVFFRQTSKERADQFEITGEVSNSSDGSVHIFATGESNNIKKLIEWAKVGPPKAKVENVRIEILVLRKFKEFKVIR